MGRRVLFGLLALLTALANACSLPERKFTPIDNLGGEGNVSGTVGGASSDGGGSPTSSGAATSNGGSGGSTSSAATSNGGSGGSTSSGAPTSSAATSNGASDGGGGVSPGSGGEGTGGILSTDSCGDGTRDAEEGCDDGNTEDGDGCSSSCDVEEGWLCAEPDTACVDCRGEEPVLGCPCTKVDEQACVGAHQKERLQCDGTTWRGLADCSGNELCESDSGECLPVIPECENTSAGFQFCEGTNVRHTCGPDWVTTEEVTCAGACESGQCVAPDCGDGVLQPDTESCDDGNLDRFDGCDDQCVKTPGWYCPTANQACVDCSAGPALDCPCVDADYPSGGYSIGDKSCNGAAQKLSIECDLEAELWLGGPVCPAGQNCEQSTGECKDIVDECEGESGGHTYCAPNDVRHVCDADLVNTSSTSCAGVCLDGVCQAPRCGDGKLQEGEVCDDGNETPADGCEPASSSAPCEESGIVKVAAGDGSTCVLLVGGHVRCWGDNTTNQLGQGDTNSWTSKHPSEIPLVDLGGAATDVEVGYKFACALLESGKVQCWGSNTSGELGHGTSTAHLAKKPSAIGPVKLSANAKALSIAPMSNMACALLTTGEVQCWGVNFDGDLGVGSGDNSLAETTAPTEYGTVALGANATQLATFSGGGCALRTDGKVRCWGDNRYGQLGLGHTESIGDDEPVYPDVPGGAGSVDLGSLVVTRLVLGSLHACALLDTGQARCWGSNYFYELGILGDNADLGDESTDDISADGVVALGPDETIVEMGLGYDHTCAVIQDAVDGLELRCWGRNGVMQLGYGTSPPTPGTIPANLPAVDIGPVKSLGAGSGFTCALLQSGELKCWGFNRTGQLGLGYTSENTGDSLPSELPAVEVF